MFYSGRHRSEPVHINEAPYPPDMDLNRDGFVSLSEWTLYHSAKPMYYGGHDQDGVIPASGEDYFEREFRRVDCDRDAKLDPTEYAELRWNARWCESPFRPQWPRR